MEALKGKSSPTLNELPTRCRRLCARPSQVQNTAIFEPLHHILHHTETSCRTIGNLTGHALLFKEPSASWPREDWRETYTIRDYM